MNTSLKRNNRRKKKKRKEGQMEEEWKTQMWITPQTLKQTINHLHFLTPNSFKLPKQE